ncbi:MAG: nucleotidyltransferase domain-containing protein [bacterium]
MEKSEWVQQWLDSAAEDLRVCESLFEKKHYDWCLSMAPEPIVNKVRKFITTAGKYGIPVKTAYLFGSWAQGRAHEWSDIDLAIISEKFEGIKFYDRRKLDRAVLEVDSDIQIHPYRPEDFNKDNPFVLEILRTGVQIV